MDELGTDLSKPFDIFLRAALTILPKIIPEALYDISLIDSKRLYDNERRIASLCHSHNQDIHQIYTHHLYKLFQSGKPLFVDDSTQAEISPPSVYSTSAYTSFALLPICTKSHEYLCIGIFFEHKHLWTSQEQYELLLFAELFTVNINSYQTMQNTLSSRQGHEDALNALRHDLHTPLTSIQGYLQLAARKISQEASESSVSRYLDIALQQTYTLQTRLEELLSLSMIDLDYFELEPSMIAPEKLVEDVVMEYRLIYPYRKITALVPKTSRQAYWDEKRIVQTLHHLFKNVLMYSPDTSPIEVQVSYSDQEVLIAIQDYGDGIDPSQQDQIFTRYWRGVDNSSRKTSYGLGIGLYLSRAFVEYHGGRLRVESSGKVGEGSLFLLELPWQTDLKMSPASSFADLPK